MAKPRILVVDDEESMRYFLTRSLKRKGYSVEAVETGEAALDRLGAGRFALMLLDLRLPGMDGIEVLERARELAPGTAVVLMTGFGSVERALSAMRRGARDFITKPFQVADVVARIEGVLGAPGAAAPAPAAAPPPAPAGAEPERPAPPRREAPPPRPLAAFLLEAARALGIPAEDPGGGDLPLRQAQRIFETVYFAELLERTSGNVSLAARLAGVSRPSLHRKIHELGIEIDRFRGS